MGIPNGRPFHEWSRENDLATDKSALESEVLALRSRLARVEGALEMGSKLLHKHGRWMSNLACIECGTPMSLPCLDGCALDEFFKARAALSVKP